MLKVMKRITFIFLMALYILPAQSQLLYFETGKVFSSFDYKNSSGKSLSNLVGSNENNLGLGFRMPVHKSALHLLIGASYNKQGAEGSDAALGNYYSWDFHTLGLNAGIDYEFFMPPINQNEQKGLSFLIRAGLETDFLTNGTQRINNQVYDLAGKEEFDKPFYFLKAGAAVNYYISKMFVVYVQYMYGQSILFGDYTKKEQLKFITHNISVGLSIRLFNYR